MNILNIMKKISKFIGAFFGVGFIPFAPGTMGSIAIFPFLFIMPFYVSFILLLIVCIIGIIFGNIVSQEEKDPSFFVLDEVAGTWIAFLFVFNFSIIWKILSLILFRLFDIYKPFPINKLEQIKDGWGIMADDIGAGIVSGIILFIINYVWQIVY